MRKLILTACTSALLFACASTPTWEGMSEETIAAWKANGLDAGQAQFYTEEGISAQVYGEWKAVNITDSDVILEWTEEKFTASKAKAWIDGGFDLDDAIENRAKGLTPVRKAEEKKEELKKEVKAEAKTAEKEVETKTEEKKEEAPKAE